MSGARRYAHVPYPWRAAIDRGSPHPARFYSALVGQTLNYRMPARRRGGAVLALAGRHGLPEQPLALAIRRFPGRERPELDALRAQLVDAWPELSSASERLPATPGELSLLALQRSAALTVFAFGAQPQPLLVAKVPSGDPRTVDLEAAALEEAAPARVGPRHLGRVGDARVQEALEGAPLRVPPLDPARAARLGWPAPLGELHAGLARLAEATTKPRAPDAGRDALERAEASDLLDARERALVAASRRDLAKLPAAVLAHGDTATQNSLFQEGRFTGLVDWEEAKPVGVPGFDALDAAIAYVDYGVGVARWSQERVVGAFAAAWEGDFGAGARPGVARAIEAAGVPDRYAGAIEVAFFAYRLGRRLERPESYPTSPRTAARRLRIACAEG